MTLIRCKILRLLIESSGEGFVGDEGEHLGQGLLERLCRRSQISQKLFVSGVFPIDNICDGLESEHGDLHLGAHVRHRRTFHVLAGRLVLLDVLLVLLHHVQAVARAHHPGLSANGSEQARVQIQGLELSHAKDVESGNGDPPEREGDEREGRRRQ